MMSKKVYRNLFILFCILNIFLLIRISKGLEGLSSGQESTGLYLEEAEAAAGIDEFQQKLVTAAADHLFTEAQESKTVKLMFVFPVEYCSGCIDFELPFLQKIYAYYPNSLVIGQIEDAQYNLKTLISESPDSLTKIREVIISEQIAEQVDSPVFFLINKDDLVLISRHSVFGDFKASEKFYKKVDAIFSLVYDKDSIFSKKNDVNI